MPTATTATTPTVHIQHVSLLRGRHRVFEDLTLALTERRIGLVGDNGAGKTSLLRLLCGLETPQTGTVQIHGVDLHHASRERAALVGLMFQNPDEQIIHPVVDEEIALSFRAAGLSKREALDQARLLLAERGRGDWASRAIGSLSQGQRQQVCWLALLAARPRVLLLDEPFASLDLPSQAALADDIASAPQQIIVSTHVLEHVHDFDRVIWLEAGRVRADGSAKEVCAHYAADVATRIASRRAGTKATSHAAGVRHG
ncbi:ABC transporter ATP-binding protein [Diaphorobacter ruginosibacter]|uniref:ABC transporter ATP-binding protein n=1 Tax=Diaphorobacter ruginosibacter TaxID=1715720 RepID=A0A7G9RTL6_9BURK|nr:ABC transporter ATP-binding protein [Diaphorobacter ruginosibacter]QNN58941.1 ABC transporter ATP-binding protein [Diaphorobacter ruginosibacter]